MTPRRPRLPLVLLGLVLALALAGTASCSLVPRRDAAPSAGTSQPAPSVTTSSSAASSPPPKPPEGPPRTLHVAAAAAPAGDGSEPRPFGTIQQGVDAAAPGDTVAVGSGTYRGLVRSVRSGTPEEPITLRGDRAVITGPRDARLVELTHDDLVVEGFEITGGNKLVWLVGTQRVRLLHNWLHDAGGECVRLRYRADGNEIAGNRIEGCGRVGFDLAADTKNGEGVYLGTAPEQLDRNQTDEPDTSRGNRIHDNVMDVPAECVDVKEDARDNVIERNTCTGGRDPEGAGFSSRGIRTVIRDNESHGHAGSGIRLGGDEDDDGVDSVVQRNRVYDNGEFGIEVNAEPQASVCGNVGSNNRDGATNTDELDVATTCLS
jgi:hypothetical protein